MLTSLHVYMSACIHVYMHASGEFKHDFAGLYQMANARKSTITVPLGEDLLGRVNTVAKSRHQSAAEFVREILDEKTKRLQPLIDEIHEREAKIQREYDKENENGQGAVRRGPSAHAEGIAKENIRNKGRKEKA